MPSVFIWAVCLLAASGELVMMERSVWKERRAMAPCKAVGGSCLVQA